MLEITDFMEEKTDAAIRDWAWATWPFKWRVKSTGSEIFQTLKAQLKAAGLNTNVGDEGGFAPNLKSAEQALDVLMQAIDKAGYKPGDDVMLALDCAATEFYKDGKYVYEGEGKTRTSHRKRGRQYQ